MLPDKHVALKILSSQQGENFATATFFQEILQLSQVREKGHSRDN